MEQAEKLVRLRKEKGLSQAEVAEELGVTRQAVSRWESGRAWPSAEKLIAVSRLYGVTVEELCSEKLAPPARDEPEETRQEADSQEENTLHRKHRLRKKELVLLTVLLLTYVSVYVAGVLTRSKSMAINTLHLLTIVIIFAWLLYSLYRMTTHSRKDDEQ